MRTPLLEDRLDPLAKESFPFRFDADRPRDRENHCYDQNRPTARCEITDADSKECVAGLAVVASADALAA
jgi:hypothetical protein